LSTTASMRFLPRLEQRVATWDLRRGWSLGGRHAVTGPTRPLSGRFQSCFKMFRTPLTAICRLPRVEIVDNRRKEAKRFEASAERWSRRSRADRGCLRQHDQQRQRQWPSSARHGEPLARPGGSVRKSFRVARGASFTAAIRHIDAVLVGDARPAGCPMPPSAPPVARSGPVVHRPGRHAFRCAAPLRRTYPAPQGG
jgi:hypothetical protein